MPYKYMIIKEKVELRRFAREIVSFMQRRPEIAELAR
jgi:hypothetical protein